MKTTGPSYPGRRHRVRGSAAIGPGAAWVVLSGRCVREIPRRSNQSRGPSIYTKYTGVM
jgi:hypothetical protein